MILVVGATGLVGREICRRLAARTIDTRALVRPTSDASKVAELAGLGIEIVRGDLRDPSSLAAACQGIETVVTTVSAMPFSYEGGVNDLSTTDRRGTLALLEAARAAGARSFVYTSFSSGIDAECPLADTKRAVERAVLGSGLACTILRPSYFMDVWLSPVAGFDFANAKAAIYGTGENPISWILAGDVAEFAVRAALDPSAKGRILELGGPEPLTPLEVVAIFERLAARPFEVQYVPEAVLRDQQEATDDPFAQSFAALQRSYAKGNLIEMGSALEAFPVELTSVEEYAALVLGKVPAAVG